MNIAINGFGRIGRTFLRTVLLDKRAKKELNVVAINIGPSDPANTALLFKYDSIMGTFPGNVSLKNNKLFIDDFAIDIIAQADPSTIDWKARNIDWVVESSGHFTKREKALLHIQAGAKKVLITAPAKNEDVTIIPGVNNEAYAPEKHNIISLGSCTTNAITPTLKLLDDAFGIEQAFMTTVHAYTNSQVLLDLPDHDPRRARAAALNIVPAETGASDVVIKVIPSLKGKFLASSLRVPVAKVSIIDLVFTSKKQLDAKTINAVFEKAAAGKLGSIVGFTTEPLVSSDYAGNSHSVTIDGLLTVADRNMGKVFGWYDNEWGYSERLKDFLLNAQ